MSADVRPTELSGGTDCDYLPANGGPALPLVLVDNLLDDEQRKRLLKLLSGTEWQFGWKSVPGRDQYSFWHKHFAGHRRPDHDIKDHQEKYDCSRELEETAPQLHNLWRALESTVLKGHTLLRCYANGLPYGSEGTLHTDSVSETSYTSIYYPHDSWHPNWGGETIFFNEERTDIVAAVYPKPNRLLIFRGSMPHVARGVARICPVLRITLMFKTELDYAV